MVAWNFLLGALSPPQNRATDEPSAGSAQPSPCITLGEAPRRFAARLLEWRPGASQTRHAPRLKRTLKAAEYAERTLMSCLAVVMRDPKTWNVAGPCTFADRAAVVRQSEDRGPRLSPVSSSFMIRMAGR